MFLIRSNLPLKVNVKKPTVKPWYTRLTVGFVFCLWPSVSLLSRLCKFCNYRPTKTS